jgi:hypothetical protein
MAAWFRLADKVLSRLDAETAHGLAISSLKSGLVPRQRGGDAPSLAASVWGQKLANPIGLAAGFDKNAEVPDAMLGLGLGRACSAWPKTSASSTVWASPAKDWSRPADACRRAPVPAALA